MSVGHSRRTSRKPSPHQCGWSASSSCRWASTPSLASATSVSGEPISWVTSDSTSAIWISRRSSLPCLRTTRPASVSSTTVGGVIQFSGLTLWLPWSDHTMNVPSALNISSRVASARWVSSRPE